jgi:hypothetical protein
MFARMAGVRNYDDEIEPIAAPRGLPDDITEITRLCYEWEKDDAHSMSWLNGSELQMLADWIATREDVTNLEGKFGYLFGNSLGGLAKYGNNGRSYPPWLVDVRLVFWFDN